MILLDEKEEDNTPGIARVLIPRIDCGITGLPAHSKDREMGWLFAFPNDIKPTLVCGKCKEISTLSDHGVRPNGELSPSIVCPNEKCNWHVFGTLEHWVEPDAVDEKLLISWTKYANQSMASVAHELLEFRARKSDNDQSPVQRPLAFALIAWGIGDELYKELSIKKSSLKKWALGIGKPHPEAVPRILAAIEKLAKEEAEKRKKKN